MPEGVYTVLIEAPVLPPYLARQQQPQTQTKDTEILSLTLEIEIDYSKNIFPLSAESALSGLTFAPMPHVLPAGSLQAEAGILAGSFRVTEDIFLGIPFGVNLRFTPFNKLEFITSFGFNSYIDTETKTGFSGWGLSVSAKYNIIIKNTILFAAGISYTTDGNEGMFPLNPGRGIGLHAPLAFDLTNISIVLSPSLLWRGPESFIPALLLSAGVLYRGDWIHTGLSARYESDFTDNTYSDPENPKFSAGAELHLFPPPSNLLFSLLGGIWTQKQKAGGYGGFKIGIIR